MKRKRTLYECLNARVEGDRIKCCCGHPFSLKSEDGGIETKRLVDGEPLALNVCQACGDFKRMGPPVPEEARGWSRKATASINRANDRGTQRDTQAAR